MPRFIALAAVLAMVQLLVPISADAAVPRVAVVVGPVGTTSEYFRDLGEEAARAAQDAGADVVRAYSPDATWPAVVDAVKGASIVVYLGHGNGFPSPYRDRLYPPTQNGFGLNPVAGSGDDAHQYFGEARVESLELAPNAVVVLSHLCYASGDAEPGMPNPQLDIAVQRVDNYAAGFIRAGAEAVVAEAHGHPAYYVRELLRGSRTIEDIWRAFPDANGQEMSAPSIRSPGFTTRLDPEHQSAGYLRSLVSRGGLNAATVRAGAGERDAPILPDQPSQPGLAGLDLVVGIPVLDNRPLVATDALVRVPLSGAGVAKLPRGMQLGFQWVRLGEDADHGPAWEGKEPLPVTQPDGQGSDAFPTTTAGTPPPELALVVPEAAGSVVELAPAAIASDSLTATTRYPATVGRYRLSISLHDSQGISYPDVQARLRALIVTVPGDVAVAYAAPPRIEASSGLPAVIAIRVANVGSTRWDVPLDADAVMTPAAEARIRTLPATLVATWVSTSGRPVPPPAEMLLDATISAPGGEGVIELPLSTPLSLGSYVLLVDVRSPSLGPLSALGCDVALVRVEVTPLALPGPSSTVTTPSNGHGAR